MQCSVLRSFAVMGENKNDDKMVLSVFIGYTHTHTHTLHTLRRLQNGYIRFDKCMSLARLVSQILAYKDTVVRLEVEHKYSMNCDCHLQ